MRYSIIFPACAVWVFAALPACGDGDPDPPTLRCGDAVGFAGVDPTGIWHIEVAYDPVSRFPAALRVDRAGDGYTATLSGVTASAVLIDDSGMLVELRYRRRQGEPLRVVTLESCDIDGTGFITGTYEFCTGGSCYHADARGRKLERMDEPASSGLTLISHHDGPDSGAWYTRGARSLNVRVRDKMAYMARHVDGLRVVDLTDPARPVDRGHMPVLYDQEYYNDVKIVAGPDEAVYAIMASNVRGAVVVDVSDPDALREVMSFPDPIEAPDGVPSIHTLFVEGTRAYLAYTYDGSLRIYDVSDPTAPRSLGSWRNPRMSTEGGYLHDLYVEDGRAYLNYWNLGMSIVDTADPAAPVLVGEYRDYGESTSHSSWVTRAGERLVAVHGDEEWGAHVRIVDVDDTSVAFLDTIGRYQTRPEVSVHNVMAHGDRAYVTYYQDGVRVLSLENPDDPIEIAHFNTWPGPESGYGRSYFEGAIGIDLDPVAGLIYVVDTHRGLFVLALDEEPVE